jgi:hypothetical protein
MPIKLIEKQFKCSMRLRPECNFGAKGVEFTFTNLRLECGNAIS